MAIQVLPNDYWSLNCGMSRDIGYTMISCPYLAAAQRLYFSYSYYLYQVQKTSHVNYFLNDWALARQQRRLNSNQSHQQLGPPPKAHNGEQQRGT